jgi:flagellar biosynthesis protein FlhG
VLLFDGDLGLANVDIQLGVMPDIDLGAMVAGRASLEDTVARHPAGFDILAGRSGSGALSVLSATALEHVLDELRDATRHYDAILLDLGAGLDRAVRRMAVFADTLLVVATEEPTSLTDAYAVLKVYAADSRAAGRPNARIVINQASSQASGGRIHGVLARACQTFLGQTPPLAGVIRRDERVREAIRRQALLLDRHPNSPAALDLEHIAGGLEV